MPSVQDLYTAIVSATQALSKFTSTFPRTGGIVTPINNLSSAGFVSILPSDPNRNSITFINPGTATAVVAPTTVGSSGGSFNPPADLSKLGGCFLVLPSSAGVPASALLITLAGVVQQGWQAMVTAGSSQPLTVMAQ
jgi:hypothetical protein